MWVIAVGGIRAAEPNARAVVVVTDKVLARDIEPLGLNTGPLSGGTNCATNQLFPNPGFEPIVLREIQRVTAGGPGWFEFDNMTYYELADPASATAPACGSSAWWTTKASRCRTIHSSGSTCARRTT